MDQTEALIIETIDRHREEILEFARDIYSHAELGYISDFREVCEKNGTTGTAD